MAHFTFALLAAAVLSAGMAFSENRPSRESLYRAIYLLLCSMAILVAGSWAMRAIHG